MKSNVLDTLQAACGGELPTFRATSRNLVGFNPLVVDGGLINPKTRKEVEGIPIGRYVNSRRAFSYDVFTLHQAELLTDLNVKIFGLIYHRKSAGVKLQIRRGVYFGRNYLVTDRKSHEYSALARAIPGSRVLRFGDGGDTFINPLDPAMPIEIKIELLTAMALNALSVSRTALTPTEHTMLWELIKHLENHRGEGSNFVPTLPALMSLFADPPHDVVQKIGVSRDRLVQDDTRDLKLALMRLVDGDLSGMFHRETTPGLFKAVPLLVLDCDGVKGEKAVVMTTLINFFTLSRNAANNSDDDRFHVVVHDEAWDLASYPGFVDSIRAGFKLGRTKGFSNWIVAHHLSNLWRSGVSERAIRDLVSDSSTSLIYRQDREEIEKTSGDLGLSEQEALITTQLPPGQALLKIRNLPGAVIEFDTWPGELELVNTSHLTHGKTDLARAKELETQLDPETGEVTLVNK